MEIILLGLLILLILIVMKKLKNLEEERKFNNNSESVVTEGLEKLRLEVEKKYNELNSNFTKLSYENNLKFNTTLNEMVEKINGKLNENSQLTLKNINKNNENILQRNNKFERELTKIFTEQIKVLTKTIDENNSNFLQKNSEFERSLNESLKTMSKTINTDNEKIFIRNKEFERELKNIFDNNTKNIIENIKEDFGGLTTKIESRLDKMNEKVELKLDKSFEKTNKTFTNVIERLSKIDEAQKNIEKLSTDVTSLQNVLTDKKTRGTFGEVQLSHILASVFGKKNDKVFKLQEKLSNETIADAVIYIPNPVGTMAIDSKFPLENYQKMVDKNNIDKTQAEKDFGIDIKKHIDDISKKYIIEGETTNQAIMFIPAEAIFAEINAYHPHLIEYANKKRVWLVSPTTFMSTLTTIQVILRDLERNKHSAILHEHLKKLGAEFKRYDERWKKLSRNIGTVSKVATELDTTANKITKQFKTIEKADMKELDELELEKDNLIEFESTLEN